MLSYTTALYDVDRMTILSVHHMCDVTWSMTKDHTVFAGIWVCSLLSDPLRFLIKYFSLLIMSYCMVLNLFKGYSPWAMIRGTGTLRGD